MIYQNSNKNYFEYLSKLILKNKNDLQIINNKSDLRKIKKNTFQLIYFENQNLTEIKLNQLNLNQKLVIFHYKNEENINEINKEYKVWFKIKVLNHTFIGISLRETSIIKNIKPLVSICIPVYNRKETLLEAIKLWNKSTNIAKELIEIVIIENGSVDFIDYNFSNFITPINYHNIKIPNLSLAREESFKVSNAEIIMFVNDDTFPNKDLIEKHLDYHLEKNSINTILLGKFIFHEGCVGEKLRDLITNDIPMMSQNEFYDGVLYSPCLSFITNNISLNKKILNKRAFDKSFTHAAFDDLSIGLYLTKKGKKVLFKKDLISFHYHSTDLLDLYKRGKQTSYWSVLFAKKNNYNYFSNSNFIVKENKVNKDMEKLLISDYTFNFAKKLNATLLKSKNKEILTSSLYSLFIHSFATGTIKGLREFNNIDLKEIKSTKEVKITVILIIEAIESSFELIDSLNNQIFEKYEIIIFCNENNIRSKVNLKGKITKIINKKINKYSDLNKYLNIYSNEYILIMRENIILAPYCLNLFERAIQLESNLNICTSIFFESKDNEIIDYREKESINNNIKTETRNVPIFSNLSLIRKEILDQNIDNKITFQNKSSYKKYLNLINDTSNEVIIHKISFLTHIEIVKEKIKLDEIEELFKKLFKENYINECSDLLKICKESEKTIKLKILILLLESKDSKQIKEILSKSERNSEFSSLIKKVLLEENSQNEIQIDQFEISNNLKDILSRDVLSERKKVNLITNNKFEKKNIIRFLTRIGQFKKAKELINDGSKVLIEKYDQLKDIGEIFKEENDFIKTLSRLNGTKSVYECLSIRDIIKKRFSESYLSLEIEANCSRSTFSISSISKNNYAIFYQKNYLNIKFIYENPLFENTNYSVENQNNLIWNNGKIDFILFNEMEYEKLKYSFIILQKNIMDKSIIAFSNIYSNNLCKFIIELLLNKKNYNVLGIRDKMIFFEKTLNYDLERSLFYFNYLKETLEYQSKLIIKDKLFINNYINKIIS